MRNKQMEKIVGAKESEAKVLEALKEYGKPVSVGYVAWKLSVTWTTARGILLEMALKGQIAATDTSKGFFFSLKPD
ncbi:MAG: hypothetical protein M1490_04665 [Candidatus Bathyarchaeota archaeon]|nr:hypothetical protein [Candidatus Bathyarchaeota archaeon]